MDLSVYAEVNRLLAASRAAHASKKVKAGRVDKEGVVIVAPNYTEAEQHIAEALSLRLQAHVLDPAHVASGWSVPIPPATRPTPDADLIAFYVAYCKPLIPEDQMAQITARFPQYAEIAYLP